MRIYLYFKFSSSSFVVEASITSRCPLENEMSISCKKIVDKSEVIDKTVFALTFSSENKQYIDRVINIFSTKSVRGAFRISTCVAWGCCGTLFVAFLKGTEWKDKKSSQRVSAVYSNVL